MRRSRAPALRRWSSREQQQRIPDETSSPVTHPRDTRAIEFHPERLRTIRKIEREAGRPIRMLMDLQGPKLRIGTMTDGKAQLVTASDFRLDLDPAPGAATRANLPHPQIFAALETGTELLGRTLWQGAGKRGPIWCGRDRW
ncbi:pyruvate kinase [Aromatoleum buckelii]|uniref:pyruvate kinase n=1 Tax=Aromatoleum buckelii TaxID=200254 RepID=UPI001FF412D9|nr:pyruvate kinase [Aromatoleum buckelii]MCK0512258.1 pyruvate kinase [Aromatoleum buckelii]